MAGNNSSLIGSGPQFGAPGMGSQPKLNITPGDLTTLICENCKGEIFAEGLVIKTVSALLTGNGKEGMLPIPAFYCVKCHEVVDRYLPEDMKKKKISL